MPNDREWQRRTDEWVKASHESRKKKEAERRDRPPEYAERRRRSR